MQNYVLEMTDGTEMTITAVDMSQRFGFLVFADGVSGIQNCGVRAELVKMWRIEPPTVKPAQIQRVQVKRKVKK